MVLQLKKVKQLGIFFSATLELAFGVLSMGLAKNTNQDSSSEYHFPQDYIIHSVLRSGYGCIN